MFGTVKYSKFTISFLKSASERSTMSEKELVNFGQICHFASPENTRKPKVFYAPVNTKKPKVLVFSGYKMGTLTRNELFLSTCFIVFYYLPYYIIYLKEGSRLIISVAYRCFLSLITPFNEISFKLTAIDYFPLFCDD